MIQYPILQNLYWCEDLEWARNQTSHSKLKTRNSNRMAESDDWRGFVWMFCAYEMLASIQDFFSILGCREKKSVSCWERSICATVTKFPPVLACTCSIRYAQPLQSSHLARSLLLCACVCVCCFCVCGCKVGGRANRSLQVCGYGSWQLAILFDFVRWTISRLFQYCVLFSAAMTSDWFIFLLLLFYVFRRCSVFVFWLLFRSLKKRLWNIFLWLWDTPTHRSVDWLNSPLGYHCQSLAPDPQEVSTSLSPITNSTTFNEILNMPMRLCAHAPMRPCPMRSSSPNGSSLLLLCQCVSFFLTLHSACQFVYLKMCVDISCNCCAAIPSLLLPPSLSLSRFLPPSLLLRLGKHKDRLQWLTVYLSFKIKQPTNYSHVLLMVKRDIPLRAVQRTIKGYHQDIVLEATWA